MRFLFLIMALCVEVAPVKAEMRPVRVFRLIFQQSDFVVHAGETWRLRWRSPYDPGDICPVYDVRIVQGSARIGANGEVQAQTYHSNSTQGQPLDLSATSGDAFVWLESGTRFAIANGVLMIEVTVFPDYP